MEQTARIAGSFTNNSVLVIDADTQLSLFLLSNSFKGTETLHLVSGQNVDVGMSMYQASTANGVVLVSPRPALTIEDVILAIYAYNKRCYASYSLVIYPDGITCRSCVNNLKLKWLRHD